MGRSLPQGSHSRSKGWAEGSMSYGEASKSARRHLEGERVLGEARWEAIMGPETPGDTVGVCDG